MRTRSVPGLTILSAMLIVLICGLIDPHIAGAQQAYEHRKTFFGPDDSEFAYPIQEGKIGQNDPVAMSEIKQAVTSSLIPERARIEVTGTLTSGPLKNRQQYPASFAIENGPRFRLDIQKVDGTHSSRINGGNGKTRQSDKAPQELEDIEFVNPLAFPSLLSEIANRKDAAIVDDGIFTVKDHSMNKVTITLFQTRFGSPVSAAFYFDSNTHMLEKGVFVEHSLGNRSLVYLTVVTYGDYTEEQSLLLPHEYSETINGQLIMNFKATDTAIRSSHDDSYFSF